MVDNVECPSTARRIPKVVKKGPPLNGGAVKLPNGSKSEQDDNAWQVGKQNGAIGHANSDVHGTENGENVVEEDGEEGDEVVPAGRVDEDGNVIDDGGNVIGRVSDYSERLNGKIVDQEGDVLDEGGNIIGKAEPIDGDAIGSQKLSQTVDATANDHEDATGGQTLPEHPGGAIEQPGKPELQKPELEAPEPEEPDLEKAEPEKPEVEQLELENPEVEEPEVEQSEVEKPEVEQLKPERPEVEQPELEKPELEEPEVEQPGPERPEVKRSELEKTELEEPEVEKPGLEKLRPTGPFKIQKNGEITDTVGNIIGRLAEGADMKELAGKSVKDIDEEGNLLADSGTIVGKADLALLEGEERLPEKASLPEEEVKLPDISILEGKKVNKVGNIVDEDGNLFGRLIEGNPKNLVGKTLDAEGKIWNDSGKVIGQAEVLPEANMISTAPFEDFPDAVVDESGNILFEGKSVGVLVEGDPKKLAGKKVDADGDVLDKHGNVIGKAERPKDGEPQIEETPDRSILAGKKVNKAGNVVDESGKPFGRLIEGDPKRLVGKTVDAEGKIWDDTGRVIGQAEVLPEVVEELIAPFEDFPDATVDKSGKVLFEGKQVGVLIEGDAGKLAGKKVDADGDVLDRYGNVLGKAERQGEEEPEEPKVEEIDCSILAGKKVNKAGNVVDNTGALFGRVVEGDVKSLIGKKVDIQGNIYNDVGKVIGRAQPIPDDEREPPAAAPFEDFPNAVVDKTGNIIFQGAVIGKLTEGDPKQLAGKQVDADGDIVDKNGNVLGKAGRWDEEEPAPPEAIDMSILAGKRVNKAGNIVDSHGEIFGRLIEGSVARLAGKMCDKDGNVRNEGGDIVGKAELVPESEREALKEGPFADFPGSTVTKDGKIVDPRGEIIGRLIEGDPKRLYGKTVDEDGDVVDKNGNVLGKAERWAEEEVKKDVNPMSGRKVNREGNVMDENGDVIGRLTEGDITKCAGKTVDDDGDVIDQKNKVIGHATLLENIPAEPEPETEPEEPKESEEELEKKRQLEQDRKLAGQMATCIEQSLDKIKPILKMITEVSVSS
jgi:hypothetical protein